MKWVNALSFLKKAKFASDAVRLFPRSQEQNVIVSIKQYLSTLECYFAS